MQTTRSQFCFGSPNIHKIQLFQIQETFKATRNNTSKRNTVVSCLSRSGQHLHKQFCCVVANGGTDRTDFINELLIANKSSGRAQESRGKLCLSSRNFEGYRHFFLLWLFIFWRKQNPKVRGLSSYITHLYVATKYGMCGHAVVASFFFETESTFMGCEREMGCLSY